MKKCINCKKEYEDKLLIDRETWQGLADDFYGHINWNNTKIWCRVCLRKEYPKID